jgi:hypothetical protein
LNILDEVSDETMLNSPQCIAAEDDLLLYSILAGEDEQTTL